MTPISTSTALDFPKEFATLVFKTIEESTKRAYHILWDIAISFLKEHWIITVSFLLALIVFAYLWAKTTRRWRWFGSLLYHYLYGGALLIIGFIFGPELFANDYFQIVLVVLYVVCFLGVGKVLRETGLKKYYYFSFCCILCATR